MAHLERDLATFSVAELLDLFVANVREVESIDHTGRKNRLWARRKRIVDAIKMRTDGTPEGMRPLLSHDDPQIRYATAFYFKQSDSETYRSVLTELAKRSDEVGRNAKSSLDWDEHLRTHPEKPETPRSRPSAWDSRLSGHKPPAGITREALESMVFEVFPRETATALLALARPAIRLWPQPLDPKAPATCSRFGGLPAMPKDWAWPTAPIYPPGDMSWFNLPRDQWPEFQEEPRCFIGQIDCADLVGLAGVRGIFPHEGLLYFFGDSDVVTGCTGGGDDDCVLYSLEARGFDRVEVPVEDFEILPSCGLGFADMMDLPHPFSREIEALALPKELMDLYHDLRERVSNYGVTAERFRELDRSKIFGWPDLVQGELDSLADAKKPRRLFAQIGNYDNGFESHGWGPGGLIYYIIDEKDLAEGQVARALCDFQCT